MMDEDNIWQSDSSESSGRSEYQFDSDGSMVASTMLNLLTDEPRSKKKGKGKKPAPKKTTSSGSSKTPKQQKMKESEKIPIYEDEEDLDMPQDVAEKIVGMAVIKVMEGHFAKLYSKIDNLKMEVSTLKTTVASLVEENKKLGEVRGNAPDPEKQPPATPVTPTKDLTISIGKSANRL
jgi:hypothetical protein